MGGLVLNQSFYPGLIKPLEVVTLVMTVTIELTAAIVSNDLQTLTERVFSAHLFPLLVALITKYLINGTEWSTIKPGYGETVG